MDLSNIPQYLQVVLGIGLVIFVHESGHYLAARWCKVRVHVFSLGFGPRLFGWKRGHTTYQVAAIPLGGYVRMAGDESMGSDGPPEPWELGAKSVPQRFLIYAGGVLMNVLFGIVVFPILVLAGIPSFQPTVGEVQPGTPVWYAGLEPGSRVLEVNDREIYDITQVGPEIAYGGSDEVQLRVTPPGSDEVRTLRLEPQYDPLMGIYSIGQITPALAEGYPLVVQPGSAAEQAGIVTGDRLLGVVGASTELAPARQLEQAVARGGSLEVRVTGASGERTCQLTPRELPGAGRALMGVLPLERKLKGLRESELALASGLEVGDTLLSLDGSPIHQSRDVLSGLLASREAYAWRVLRLGRELELESPPLSEREAVALYADLAFENDMGSSAVYVYPRSAAALAGLRSGDLIEKIDGQRVAEYEDVRVAAGLAARQGRAIRLELLRVDGASDGQRQELSILPAPLGQLDYGLALERARYDFRVTNGVKAIALGVTSCVDMLRDVGRTLSGVLRQEVSEDNLGGIITIGVIAKHSADSGLVKFFWFLCMLSMNLAFLNVLPIPLLDGGHLFFLLVEGIKGSPVSERILSYSQLIGLVLIVSIFVFVIYNDLSMHVFN
jgi:regulator of sigma E protease